MKKQLTPHRFWSKTMKQTLLPLLLMAYCTIVAFAKPTFAQQDPLERKVSLNMDNQAIGSVLKQIEKQVDVKFVFSPQVVDVEQKVSVKVKDEPLTTVFSAVLKPLNIQYELSGKYILLTLNPIVAQNLPTTSPKQLPRPLSVILTGTVSDEKNEPLVGVSVVLKGTTTGTITDIDGKFQLELPDAKGVLVFSFIGYQNTEFNIGKDKKINVQLFPDNKMLSEAVVVGYSERRRDELSGAVTSISSEMLTLQPVTSLDQALQGMSPGVSLREGSGAPGAGPEILIRGINTFGSNKPLFVIDDVIIENGNDQNNNPLSLINPEDIENIVILKDAATKAIYGSRATGGVIQVTTKRGKLGKPKITFNSNIGFANPMEFEKPDVLNATELAQFNKEKTIDQIRATNPLYSDVKTAVPDSLIPVSLRNPSQYGVGTNWYDEVVRQAQSQNHNISVSGGTAGIRYFVSGNFLKQDGVVLANDITRLALRSNLDVRINEKLKFGFNLNPSRTEQNRTADDPSNSQFSAYSTITSTYWADPTATVYQPNGIYNYTTRGALASSWTANPIYQLYEEDEVRRNTQILAGSFLEFEPLKNLVVKTNLSYAYNQTRSRNFKPSRLVIDNLNPPDPLTNAIAAQPDGARAQLFNANGNNLISDNTIRYRFKVKRHSFDLLGGYLIQDVENESSNMIAKRIVDEYFRLPDFNNVDKAVQGAFSGSEEYSQNRLLSTIGRLNYNFADRYLVNFSYRRDGSSRFGRTVQFGNFPAGSFTWKASEENFVKKALGKWVNDLRFEVGYGFTGNQNDVTPYGHLGSITTSNYLFGSPLTQALGNTIGRLPNGEITWEESKQFDLGFNLGMYKNRIKVAFNVYQQITDGLLADIPISWTTGFGSVRGNQDSKIRNRGFEAEITAIPIQRKGGLTWQTSLNFSQYRNLILEYFDSKGFTSGLAGNGTAIAISQAGYPVGMYRGLKTQGLFTAADIANPSVPKYAGAREGSQKYLDGNGDGKLDIEADYVLLGNPHPDLMFGWNNTLNYKGFSLRTILAGQLGGLIYDLRREIMWNVDGNFNIDRQMLDRWRPGDDPTTKTFPTTVSTAGSITRYVRFPSDNKIYDGSYAALKNITLSYNAGRLLNKKRKWLEQAEVYTSVRNAFYISAYKYGNPEIRRSNDGGALRSVNYGSYPISRTVTLGLNVTF
jgi:TonB-dependent starch-binding outer membrane protein SusC